MSSPQIKTVFILGAGVSRTYGFPSGMELQQNLANIKHYGNGVVTRMLLNAGFDLQHLTEFCESLNLSGVASVDEWLLHNMSFNDLAKACIAYEISRHEKSSQLRTPDHNVYQYFWDKIRGSVTEFPKQDISFITFNYDRSLEMYFAQAIQNTYRLDDDTTLQTLQKIPIVHVHGQLGLLPFHKAKADKRKGVRWKYGSLFESSADLRRVSESIRIIHEEVNDSDSLNKAKELIHGADRIFLLGFGFHQINIERIELKQWLKNGKFDHSGYCLGDPRKAIFATGYGIADGTRRNIQNCLGTKLQWGNSLEQCRTLLERTFIDDQLD